MRKIFFLLLIFAFLVSPIAAQDDPLMTALRLIRAGDFEQAITIYDDYLADNPDDAEVYAFRALVYAELEDYDTAFEGIQTALDVAEATQTPQILALRAELYVRSGEIDLAIADYDSAVELDPEYAVAYYNRGILYDGLEDYDHALADYTQVITLMPDAINTYLSRARIYSLQENAQAALDDYDTVIGLNPDLPEPYIMRGHANTLAENTQSAAADYAEWLLHIETERRTHTQVSADLNRRLVMRFGQIHELPFEGIAGQHLSVTANSPTVDSLVVLLGPDDRPLVADDDSGDDLNAAILNFALPETGRYTLIVGHARGGWDGITALSLSLSQVL